MKKLFSMAALCGLCISAPVHAYAQGADIRMDEVVVSASKYETPLSELASSVSVVTEDDLEAQQSRTLVEAMQSVPGIFFATQEGPAGMNGISIRGAGSNYTQFRYDGFPLRDATDLDSSFSSFYSYLNLAPGSVGRIEVLKGAQSTLYGSNAMAGVVSIYPSKKWDSGFNASLDVAGGSWGTFRTSGQVSYGDDKYYVNFAPLFTTSDGYNGLWYDQGGFTLGAGMRFSEKTSLELSTLFASFRNAAYDSQTFDESTGKWSSAKPLDKASYHNEGNYILTGLTLTHEFSDAWKVQGKAAFTSSEREYVNTMGASEYLSQGSYFELANTLRPMENLTLIAGAEYEAQWMEIKEKGVSVQDKSSGDMACYAKGLLAFMDKKLNLSAGARFNKDDDFDAHTTWELGLSYAFDTGTRVFGRTATGYRTPSLYQSFGGPWYIGNADLKPETSQNFEVGVEQSFWDNKVMLSATAFSTDYEDQLAAAYDFNSGKYVYENASEAKVRGFELGLSLQPHEKVRFEAAYTHSSSKQKTSGGDWVHGSQMPEDKVSATLSLFPVEKLTLSLTGRWEGRRTLNVYPVGFMEEDDFFTMDLAAAYDINERLRIYAKVNNILDEDYAIRGWEMPGINAMAGLRMTF